MLATRSVFYPDSEEVMGWRISERGFEVVLSADVPKVVLDAPAPRRGRLPRRARASAPSRRRAWIAHPGGPKVLEAMQQALEVASSALELELASLREVGNLSSTSVLLVLDETMRDRRPSPGDHGLLLAMGPGFCSELVLLRW